MMSVRSRTPVTPEMTKVLPILADNSIMKSFSKNMNMSHARTYFNPASRKRFIARGFNSSGNNNTQTGYTGKRLEDADRFRSRRQPVCTNCFYDVMAGIGCKHDLVPDVRKARNEQSKRKAVTKPKKSLSAPADLGRSLEVRRSTGRVSDELCGKVIRDSQVPNALYSRFTTGDWDLSNNTHYSMSDRERSYAERLRADAWRAIKETDARTRNRQTTVTKRLGERVDDITYWKEELNKECRAMENEIANLHEHKRVLEKAYLDTAQPLDIAEKCLENREMRQGIDQVHDDVERQLIKEVAVIKRCQERMKKVLQKAHIQLKLDRAALHEMSKDQKDKFHAQNLDDRMYQLRNSSQGIGYHPGIENVDNTLTIPESWARFTQNNIIRSQKERAASERLRGEIDQTLRQCANDMWSQFNSVNNSFNARIRETADARNKLQAHLQRTMREIHDMEKNIELLRKAIRDKEAPMKVAQTRLEERCRRLNVELCNDPVMKTLQREVQEIRDSVRYLKEKLKHSEISMARLQKTKNTLQHDIAVKDNSLDIDAKGCMGRRKAYPAEPKVGPIFNMPLAY